jgi:hypothetical protein
MVGSGKETFRWRVWAFCGCPRPALAEGKKGERVDGASLLFLLKFAY